jgi:hypothetical protein
MFFSACVDSFRLTITNPATKLMSRFKTGIDYHNKGGCLGFNQLQNGLEYTFQVEVGQHSSANHSTLQVRQLLVSLGGRAFI